MTFFTLYIDERSRLPTVWSRLVKFFAKLGIKIVTWELSKDAHNVPCFFGIVVCNGDNDNDNDDNHNIVMMIIFPP